MRVDSLCFFIYKCAFYTFEYVMCHKSSFPNLNGNEQEKPANKTQCIVGILYSIILYIRLFVDDKHRLACTSKAANWTVHIHFTQNRNISICFIQRCFPVNKAKIDTVNFVSFGIFLCKIGNFVSHNTTHTQNTQSKFVCIVRGDNLLVLLLQKVNF